MYIHSSRDYPGIVCVSQESQDTRTRGMLQGELHVHVHSSRDYPGMVCIPGIPGYLNKGHAARRALFIPGLSRKFLNYWLLWDYCGML